MHQEMSCTKPKYELPKLGFSTDHDSHRLDGLPCIAYVLWLKSVYLNSIKCLPPPARERARRDARGPPEENDEQYSGVEGAALRQHDRGIPSVNLV